MMNDEERLSVPSYEDELNGDLAQRKREIASQSQLIEGAADLHHKQVLSRFGVVLLCAHWEGFVKFAVKRYLDLFEGCVIAKAPSPIKAAIIRKRYGGNRERHPRVGYKLFADVLTNLGAKDLRAPRDLRKIIDYDFDGKVNFQNLNLFFIMFGLEVTDDLKLKEKFINNELIQTRHAIAHGEFKFIEAADFFNMKEQILALFEILKAQFAEAAERSLKIMTPR
ncbi:MAG: hypothetical protein LBU64_06770 [Planctomycetota bacterium]|jgi:hypothetical protein|nr:hypothetical protein [Planctomycetota bacterium]